MRAHGESTSVWKKEPLHEARPLLMKNAATCFIATDCTQLEITLAETPDGDIVVCDAKVNFDDNAEFRQSSVFARRDSTQEDPREVEAAKYDLNYIGLDGTIGCMVNELVWPCPPWILFG
jgi:succinyl-CoA synthetase beta subunit